MQDLEKHMVLDKAQVEELTRALAEVEPALDAARCRDETAAGANCGRAEQLRHSWQKQFEDHHLQSTKQTRDADRCRAEIEVLDQRLLQASRRLEALGKESELHGRLAAFRRHWKTCRHSRKD